MPSHSPHRRLSCAYPSIRLESALRDHLDGGDQRAEISLLIPRDDADAARHGPDACDSAPLDLGSGCAVHTFDGAADRLDGLSRMLEPKCPVKMERRQRDYGVEP
jgi:hypothetical protein